MIAQTKNPDHKLQLEEMAAAWDMLAKVRAKKAEPENDLPQSK
jgi:hypothetical protein